MDYSKLSDAGIASKVLIAQGYKLIDDGYGYSIYISDSGRKDIGPKASKKFVFDPCKNPADAWPIITSARISLLADYDKWDETTAACGSDSAGNYTTEITDQNPLRAAMIVFLMNQEGER